LNSKETIFTVFIVLLISLFTAEMCINHVNQKNKDLEIQKLQKEIILLKEKNDSQDSLIAGVIRTQAMLGTFDKTE